MERNLIHSIRVGWYHRVLRETVPTIVELCASRHSETALKRGVDPRKREASQLSAFAGRHSQIGPQKLHMRKQHGASLPQRPQRNHALQQGI